MVSMMLMTLWGALDFFLLAAGGVMIAFSILWKAPDVFRNLVMTEMDLTGALPPSAPAIGLLTTLLPLVTTIYSWTRNTQYITYLA